LVPCSCANPVGQAHEPHKRRGLCTNKQPTEPNNEQTKPRKKQTRKTGSPNEQRDSAGVGIQQNLLCRVGPLGVPLWSTRRAPREYPREHLGDRGLAGLLVGGAVARRAAERPGLRRVSARGYSNRVLPRRSSATLRVLPRYSQSRGPTDSTLRVLPRYSQSKGALRQPHNKQTTCSSAAACGE
jgi:hypothetical protein